MGTYLKRGLDLLERIAEALEALVQELQARARAEEANSGGR